MFRKIKKKIKKIIAFAVTGLCWLLILLIIAVSFESTLNEMTAILFGFNSSSNGSDTLTWGKEEYIKHYGVADNIYQYKDYIAEAWDRAVEEASDRISKKCYADYDFPTSETPGVVDLMLAICAANTDNGTNANIYNNIAAVPVGVDTDSDGKADITLASDCTPEESIDAACKWMVAILIQFHSEWNLNVTGIYSANLSNIGFSPYLSFKASPDKGSEYTRTSVDGQKLRAIVACYLNGNFESYKYLRTNRVYNDVVEKNGNRLGVAEHDPDTNKSYYALYFSYQNYENWLFANGDTHGNQLKGELPAGLSSDQARVMITIYNQLVSGGFSSASAMGVLANIGQESSFVVSYEDYPFGVFQLCYSGFRESLKTYAQERGEEWPNISFETQVDWFIDTIGVENDGTYGWGGNYALAHAAVADRYGISFSETYMSMEDFRKLTDPKVALALMLVEFEQPEGGYDGTIQECERREKWLTNYVIPTIQCFGGVTTANIENVFNYYNEQTGKVIRSLSLDSLEDEIWVTSPQSPDRVILGFREGMGVEDRYAYSELLNVTYTLTDGSTQSGQEYSYKVGTAYPGTGIGVLQFPIAASSIECSSSWGWRVHPIKGTIRFHNGLDMGCSSGTAVYSMIDGVVTTAEYYESCGNDLVIRNDDLDIEIEFMHLNEILVEEGDYVSVGDLVAKSGNTGVDTTAPHLHVEVRYQGVYQNPEAWW